jgi:hypothetical protein
LNIKGVIAVNLIVKKNIVNAINKISNALNTVNVFNAKTLQKILIITIYQMMSKIKAV